MEAALEEPVYRVGNIQRGRTGTKETSLQPSLAGFRIGATRGACNKYDGAPGKGEGPQKRSQVGQGCYPWLQICPPWWVRKGRVGPGASATCAK